jgi:hypothetical protein
VHAILEHDVVGFQVVVIQWRAVSVTEAVTRAIMMWDSCDKGYHDVGQL